MTSSSIEVAGRTIGPGHAPFVIAEAGVNHNGDPELARRLIDAAADAGADAVKFQTYEATALATAQAERAAYQRDPSGSDSQLAMLQQLELARGSWAELAAHAAVRGIVFLSSPFDVPSVDLLAGLGVPAFKIGSGDLTNAMLLRAVARHRRPVLLSTGMGTLEDVDAALAELRSGGAEQVALLHCVSIYPAELEDVNLRAIDTLRDRFDVPVGFSDHTVGLLASIVATGRGAALIEKHLTLDRSLPGPDHAASLTPATFAELIDAIGRTWTALGDGVKRPRDGEREIMRVARRSLVTSRPLSAGHVLTLDDLDAKRPGTGLSPMMIDTVVGRRLAGDLEGDHVLRPTDVDPPIDRPG